jgi:CTP:molybdopterin cytidylyltransferase MocA
MEAYHKIAAIVLAAGYSSRMGELKPLLSLGDKTVLEKVIDAFRKAGIDDVRVVVGYEAQRLIPLLEKRKVQIIQNIEFEKGMFSSVQAGIKSLQVGNTEGFFIMPADYPLIKPDTLKKLVEAYQTTRSKIIYPRYASAKGHPPILSIELIEEILHFQQPGGLRKILERYQSESEYLEVTDRFILMDMDTIKDYERMVNANIEDQQFAKDE